MPPTTPGDDAGAPETDVQQALDWVLDALAKHRPLSDSDIDAHFTPSFLAQVPRQMLVEVFDQLASELTPFRVTAEKAVTDTAMQARLDTAQGPYSVSIEVEPDAPHRILALYFAPIAPPIEPPQSYAEASARLAMLASSRQLLVAELVNDRCEPIEQVNTQARLAIGSAFKLWVLLTVDEKLQTTPELSWDSKLTIQEALKSLPSGTLQNQPAGTQLSLREFAQKMISISDNTAADHLIDFVGRTNVENIQATAMHGDAAANIPWLYTRELFALKGWATPQQLDAYRRASVDEKRTLLEQLRATPLQPDKVSWMAPRLLELEWFANPNDLCNVLRTLATRAKLDPSSELLQILTINPGAALDPAQYRYLGYKGGSEPGVLNLSWLLQRADGRWFVVVVSLNDAQKPIDESTASQLAMGVLKLLAESR